MRVFSLIFFNNYGILRLENTPGQLILLNNIKFRYFNRVVINRCNILIKVSFNSTLISTIWSMLQISLKQNWLRHSIIYMIFVAAVVYKNLIALRERKEIVELPWIDERQRPSNYTNIRVLHYLAPTYSNL